MTLYFYYDKMQQAESLRNSYKNRGSRGPTQRTNVSPLEKLAKHAAWQKKYQG